MNVEEFKKEWLEVRGETLKFLNRVPGHKLDFSLGEGFGSIGRQLRHTADVEACYFNALESKRMNWDHKYRARSMERSKPKLEKYFKELDSRLFALLDSFNESDLQEKVVWLDKGNPTRSECLELLIEHEKKHQDLWKEYALKAGF